MSNKLEVKDLLEIIATKNISVFFVIKHNGLRGQIPLNLQKIDFLMNSDKIKLTC